MTEPSPPPFPTCDECANRFDRADPRADLAANRATCPLCRALLDGATFWAISNPSHGPFEAYATHNEARARLLSAYGLDDEKIIPAVLITRDLPETIVEAAYREATDDA